MDAPCPAATFTVLGLPAPKGSRTVGRRADGRIFTRPASKREHPWIEAVARAASEHDPLPPPYGVALSFCMPRPARPAHPYPTRGDIDKLVRAVLDGLTRGGLIVDDAHVTSLDAHKYWVDPGLEGVTVTVAGDGR